jgi:hypothetical protein
LYIPLIVRTHGRRRGKRIRRRVELEGGGKVFDSTMALSRRY